MGIHNRTVKGDSLESCRKQHLSKRARVPPPPHRRFLLGDRKFYTPVYTEMEMRGSVTQLLYLSENVGKLSGLFRKRLTVRTFSQHKIVLN